MANPSGRQGSENENSQVGPSLRLKGDMSADGSISIAGQFEGNIEIPKRQVTVAEGAVVKADIRASKVLIRGKVRGNVQGIDRVELTGTADMTGQLQTREIRVEEGAIFRGQVDIITERE